MPDQRYPTLKYSASCNVSIKIITQEKLRLLRREGGTIAVNCGVHENQVQCEDRSLIRKCTEITCEWNFKILLA